ncbi:hypothetical protein JTB14_013405 [Gonioctena quinquepunctata]|nr:hypothetical protein JTB14_013405 [Gonioctena quinquepunctata]
MGPDKSSASIVFIFVFASVLADPPKSPPVWSKTYSVKGILHIPYAEIDEPFYAWYDAPSKQSRIDYYGDMVKTYQLGTSGFGTSLKVAPITTESEENARTCSKLTEQRKIKLYHSLFCLLWMVLNVQVEKQLMALKRKNGSWPKQSAKKYEMRGFNSLLGSHYDHYYLEYDSYNINDIAPETFKIDSNMTCSAFPGPGDRHIYTFNPMAEFIRPEKIGHVDFEFNKFMRKHRKQYTDKKEHTLRKEIFRQNIRFIHSVNRQNKGYSLTVNHLADKTDTELKALRGKKYTGVYNGGKPFPYQNIDQETLPEQFDWRIYGAVTPVKDQSVCGSCWSFGTVGAIEGAYFLKNGGNLVRLSQQALIDCSWGFGNNGCDGGEDFRAYQWMLKHGGIPTEEDYGPYLGQDGYCHANKVPKVATITGWINVTTNNENALRMALVNHGPISVAIDASHRTFSFYSNGVYDDPACGNKEENLDHAVLAVGYGSINGKHYWLVKNSWSNYWGNDGYVLMAAKDNNCGVMTTPTYVTM